jgi:glycosyltransferase involved in cell wall biosynthesis
MNQRLLIVGTAYAIREHRKKLSHLAKQFDLTCVTANQCGGFGWTEKVEPDSWSSDYQLVGVPISGAATAGTRTWYRGLASVFRKQSYDLILVENEPWGVLRWQTWVLKQCFQRRALFGEFTWENILRGGIKGRILELAYRVAARTADFAIAGNHCAAAILKRVGAHPARTFCLPQFGVDPEIFAPLSESERAKRRASAGYATNARLIAYCGRFVPEKGVLDLLAAFQSLPHPSEQTLLLFMGAGPLAATLDAAARRDVRIRVVSPMAYPAIATFLQLLDVLVLPSRTSSGPVWWKEQFGHILIEAMACGVVTIGSNCGAIPEVIGEQDCIFSEADVGALRNLLQRTLQDDNWRAAKTAAARTRVLMNYTHEELANRYTKVFNSLFQPQNQKRIGKINRNKKIRAEQKAAKVAKAIEKF